jgi:SPP1 family predicted phage head-tail adaptor
MSKSVYIGQLKDRITIEEPNASQNAYGEEVNAWATITDGTIYARVEWANTGSGEVFSKQGIASYEAVNFVVRHRTDLNAKMRVLYKSTYYNIKNIKEIEFNKYLEIVAVSSDSNTWE